MRSMSLYELSEYIYRKLSLSQLEGQAPYATAFFDGLKKYMEEKIANLRTIYPQVAGQTGTLNMSAFTGKNEMITFSAVETAVPDAEQQEQEAAAEDTQTGESADGGENTDGETQEGEDENKDVNGTAVFMVFDSNGTLHYDAHVVNGQVVDANGNPIEGCTVDANGNAVDAYMNVIDPDTGAVM